MLPAEVDYALTLPPDQAAQRLLELSENQWFERKSGAIKPADFAIPLVAMANSEGGIVVAGLHNGEIRPVSDKANNALRQVPIDFTSPPLRAYVSEIHTSEGTILVFRIPPSAHVHETQRGECYQRIGDESRRLTYAQRQELEWDRGVASFDGTPIPGGKIDDLNPEKLEEYRRELGSTTAELALKARDLLTRNNDLTVAAFLLFSSRPQIVYPNAYVRVLKYRDMERGLGRDLNLDHDGDIRCEGPIPEQISQAIDVVNSLIPRRRALVSGGRFEGIPIIPEDAWIEGLVNAVVHRSYSIGGDHIRIEIFPDRIEITSPGRFPGMLNLADPQSFSRHARNPRIARVCSDMGITQELGEGIRRIYAEMRRAGLIEPMYYQSPEAVRLTLMATRALPDEIVTQIGSKALGILTALRHAHRPLSTGQIAELTGYARPTVLRHLKVLRQAGLVAWDGDSPQDPQATWRVL